MDFQPVQWTKKRRTSTSSPGKEHQRDGPSHHCKYPVILIGLPTMMRNPLTIRRYIETSHPTAQVIGLKTSTKGLIIIAAQDATSQSTLLKEWPTTQGRTPTARPSKAKKEERPGPIQGVIAELPRRSPLTGHQGAPGELTVSTLVLSGDSTAKGPRHQSGREPSPSRPKKIWTGQTPGASSSALSTTI